jgi:membrane protease YdiL (CAAX protease family)
MIRVWTEFLLLFFSLPFAVFLFVQDLHTWLMPILGVCALVCLILLLNDENFKRHRLFSLESFFHKVRPSLLLFVGGAITIGISVWALLPEWFLAFPKQHPQVWLLTLFIYPIVSVIPQELIFRTFFFHRYKRIMPSKHVRLGMSSLSFGLAHMVYGNWVAVIMSGLGGLLFGYRYMQTKSTAVVVVEHTLWGTLVFTIGFGVFFLPPL